MDKRKEDKRKQKKGKKDFLFKFDSGQYSLAHLYFHITLYIGSDLDEDKVVPSGVCFQLISGKH